MTTLALQLAADGIYFSRMPDPIALDADNLVVTEFVPWPVVRHPNRGRLPLNMEERVMAYAAVREIVADADEVVLAIESGVDRVRVGVVEVALDHADIHVVEVQPHPDGAAGLMREHVDEVVQQMPRPPGT